MFCWNEDQRRLMDFVGKKVKNATEERLEELGVEWETWEDDTPEGCGTVELAYRDCDSEDPDGEESAWGVTILLSFEVDADGAICEIQKEARISCFRGDGLGDCDPDEYWEQEDYDAAVEILEQLVSGNRSNCECLS